MHIVSYTCHLYLKEYTLLYESNIKFCSVLMASAHILLNRRSLRTVTHCPLNYAKSSLIRSRVPETLLVPPTSRSLHHIYFSTLSISHDLFILSKLCFLFFDGLKTSGKGRRETIDVVHID